VLCFVMIIDAPDGLVGDCLYWECAPDDSSVIVSTCDFKYSWTFALQAC